MAYCQSQPVSFYVVGEPDQWQLFMGINAYKDIFPGHSAKEKKVVIIYVTAGDESCDGASLNIPLFLARQKGANDAVEFCADQPGWHYPLWSSADTSTGHSILEFRYRNVISYCLKLPSGCDGTYLRKNSLQYLYKNSGASIVAVDSSSIYTGWEDLSKTIQALMINECGGLKVAELNTADTDLTINPGDHADNITTARLALDAFKYFPHGMIHFYQEYNTANLPVNLDDKSMATEAALLSMLDMARTENGQPSEWDARHVSFTARNYFRTIKK